MKCIVKNCENERYGNQKYCKRHYYQARRYGENSPKLLEKPEFEFNGNLKGEFWIKLYRKQLHLGYFKTDIEAFNAYLSALEKYGIKNKYAMKQD